MRKKAQITMESLLLYGAAILVVLLAIAALTYFGVLDLGRLLPEKCNFKGSGIFNCEEYAASVNTNSHTLQLSFVLSNRGSKTVTVKNAQFLPVDNQIMTSACSQALTDPSGNSIVIPPGGQDEIDLTCNNFFGTPDSRVSGSVKLTHSFGTLDQTTNGDITITMSDATQ
jgi:uncharacterized protein (UPF0333 family)